MTKPCVRTSDGKSEIDLETYSALNNESVLTDELLTRVTSGVSAREYTKTISKARKRKGVSKSAVSRRVIAASQAALEQFEQRRWDDIKMVTLLIDGVHVGKTHVVAAIGIDRSGQKHVLGWQIGSAEHEVVCRDLLRKLIEAGLSPDGEYAAKVRQTSIR